MTNAYPLPRIDELLDGKAWGNFLITIDLSKGYWEIPLDVEAVPESAFITPSSLYQSRVMPRYFSQNGRLTSGWATGFYVCLSGLYCHLQR